MPQLVIVRRPDSLVNGDSVEVEFAGRDDRTPPEKLRFTVQLFHVPDGGGMPEMVQTLELPPAERSVRVDDLPDGVYKIRVVVADGVGNVTSQDIGFVVVGEGGCSLSGGAPPTALPLLLLLLSLIVIRSRVPRR